MTNWISDTVELVCILYEYSGDEAILLRRLCRTANTAVKLPVESSTQMLTKYLRWSYETASESTSPPPVHASSLNGDFMLLANTMRFDRKSMVRLQQCLDKRNILTIDGFHSSFWRYIHQAAFDFGLERLVELTFERLDYLTRTDLHPDDMGNPLYDFREYVPDIGRIPSLAALKHYLSLKASHGHPALYHQWLFFSIASDRMDCVEYITSVSGLSVGTVGVHAMHAAIESKSIAMVRLVCPHYRNLITDDQLFSCIRFRLLDVSRFLVEQCGCRTHGFDQTSGDTPLHRVALHPEMSDRMSITFAKLIIDNFPNPEMINVWNVQGVTALGAAASAGKPELCAYLLHRGAGFRARDLTSKSDELGRSPFARCLMAPWTKNVKRICDLLIDQKVNINLRDNMGQTPVFHACLGSNIGALEYLVELKADWAKEDSFNVTPLEIAAFAFERNPYKPGAREVLDRMLQLTGERVAPQIDTREFENRYIVFAHLYLMRSR